ncbi:hypothetical protein [Streptosporangium roseum]|uniref:hypothetical protein n=1 Tax=Streptosporangium roseum TaxID=2001 RepID=UPI00031767F5|nr:hypothetical protein [Streptosporangium roseum]
MRGRSSGRREDGPSGAGRAVRGGREIAVRGGEGFEARPYGPRHLRRGRRGDVEGLAEGEEPGFEIVR